MPRYFLYAALLLLTQCSKCKKDNPTPEEQLPPATQTGANTFGCLVNGQVYTPKGHVGPANFSVSYDPGYLQGTLNIAAYRYENSQARGQTMAIFSDSLQTTGRYKLGKLGHHGAGFTNDINNCEYSLAKTTTYCRGQLIVTRLDRKAGIVAGSFEFMMATPTCDTIKVTQGRFDYKL